MSLNTAQAVAIQRSLTAKFDVGFDAAQPFYGEICTTVPSDGADEEYGILGAMPQVREWVSERVEKELRAAQFSLVNKDWESTLRIKKNNIKDDRMGMYGPLLQELGSRAGTHPDKLLIQCIVGGETAPCFDGQNFYDTDHSWGDSGTQDNDLESIVSNPDAVTVAEFKTAYRAAVTKLIGYKDDQGEPMNQPTIDRMAKLVCMVPPALRDVAHDAVESVVLSNSSNVVIDRPRIVCSPHLTSARKFYIHNTEGFLRPFVFQAREPLSRQMQDWDNAKVKDALFMTSARYNLGYLCWWMSVLTTFRSA